MSRQSDYFFQQAGGYLRVKKQRARIPLYIFRVWLFLAACSAIAILIMQFRGVN